MHGYARIHVHTVSLQGGNHARRRMIHLEGREASKKSSGHVLEVSEELCTVSRLCVYVHK